jgi:hypothetical protein
VNSAASPIAAADRSVVAARVEVEVAAVELRGLAREWVAAAAARRVALVVPDALGGLVPASLHLPTRRALRRLNDLCAEQAQPFAASQV